MNTVKQPKEQPLSDEEREDMIGYLIGTMRLSGIPITREEAERAIDEVYSSDEPMLVDL